jgi:F420-non-reducing hydrogenase iron-sulfur subunit
MTNTKRQLFTPKIVTFVCNWCSSASGDLVGPIRTPYRGIPRVMRVLCTGRIQADDILAALEMGSDGVLIAGCEDLECNYRTGNMIAKRRVRFVKSLLKHSGFSEERVEITLGFLQLIREPVNLFRKKIMKLGPLGQGKGEGMTPEEVRMKLAIARKVTQDTEIGWLVGKEAMLTEKHNTYGETLSQDDFDKMIVDYIVEKRKLYTVLSKIEKVPMTIPQISKETEILSTKVFDMVQSLVRDGLVSEAGKSGRYYQYIQA